ncbi:MAG TPA: hypothetical protein VII94_04205 [Candidatus Saccharimonadales bacterium]
MTAIKAKQEPRIIFDFSSGKYSKNKIKQILRNCEVVNGSTSKEGVTTIYHNQIKVGMYTLHLCLPYDSPFTWNKLKQFKDFGIDITDPRTIDLRKDIRFRDKYWVMHDSFGNLRIKHLIDIIDHCCRLNKLRAFL